jgi:hypothetical protein
MRKTLASLVAVGVVGAFAAAASAQSVMYFDVRDGSSGIQSITSPVAPFTNGQDIGQIATNTGGAGDGQILRIAPTQAGGNHSAFPLAYPNFDADGNSSTGNLHLYDRVSDDASGTGDVISSIGVDFNVTAASATPNAYGVASVNWSWDTANWQGTNAGVNNGASNGGSPPSWLGAKAVKVPVNASAQYDTTGGLTPNLDGTPRTYHLGALRVTGAPRNCANRGGTDHLARSTFNVKMAVNDLLITRVFQTGGDAVELVSFGYASGTPETAVSGSQVGNTSATPDAVIQVGLKGDASGDGNVTNADITPFLTARTASASNSHKQSQTYWFDFSGDNRVTNADITNFLAARTASSTCP